MSNETKPKSPGELPLKQPAGGGRTGRDTKATMGIPRNLWSALTRAAPKTSTVALRAVRGFAHGGDVFLALLGPVGTGKTFAACCWLWEQRGRGNLYVSSQELRRRNWFDTAQVDPVFTAPHLILDDCGMEFPGSDWPAKLDELVTRRDSDELPTVLTSNWPPEAFRQAVGDRAWDRITGRGRIVECVGPSLRQKKGQA